MRFSGFLLRDLDRGKMLEADYLWLREIDDIADGDLAVPVGYATPAEYVAEKLGFLLQAREPKDDVEALMLFCDRLSVKTGLNLTHARQMIIESMLFDAQRLGTGTVFPEAELQEYFYNCDIVGTAAGALPLFGEPLEKWPFVYEMGQAVRIYYNLRDFSKDVRAGLVNISAEDVTRFNVTVEDLQDVDSQSVKAWFKDQAHQGLVLLEQGKQKMREGNFGQLSRSFVYFYHERPAEKFLKGVEYYG